MATPWRHAAMQDLAPVTCVSALRGQGWAVMGKTGADSNGGKGWFWYDAARWREFKRGHAVALGARRDLVAGILAPARDRPVTLLYSARDPDHNQAVALAAYLAAATEKN